jgi:hypothetical protein
LKRLREHSRVFVSIPDGRRSAVEAVVLVFSERGMTLQAVNAHDVSRLTEVAPGSFVTFHHGRSLIALAGTVFPVKPEGTLRFQASERSARRSRGTRVKFEMPVTVRRVNSSVDGHGKTVDVGPDGLLIMCDLDIVTGEEVVLSFTSPEGGRLVTGAAEVVRGVGSGLAALHLPATSQDARNVLGEYVTELSRAALARTELRREQSEFDTGPSY